MDDIAEISIAEDTKDLAEHRVRSAEIAPPNFEIVQTWIEGTSQLVQCAFGTKAREGLMAIQRQGTTSRSRSKTRTPKDFEQTYQSARHISEEGWDGAVSTSIRNALISACGMSQYQRAKAKRSLLIVPDGIDKVDGWPLIRIHGKVERFDCPARLLTTGSFDVRSRPRWRKWAMQVTIEFDADWFRPLDVMHLLARAGKSIGIGEGRYDSKNSNGLGWGCFKLAEGKLKL